MSVFIEGQEYDAMSFGRSMPEGYFLTCLAAAQSQGVLALAQVVDVEVDGDVYINQMGGFTMVGLVEAGPYVVVFNGESVSSSTKEDFENGRVNGATLEDLGYATIPHQVVRLVRNMRDLAGMEESLS